IEAVRVDGGPSRSDYLMRLQADILQRPLLRSGYESLTGYGSALMAGLGSGVWTNLDRLSELMRPSATINPDRSSAARWDAAYRDWLDATEAVLDLHRDRRASDAGATG
ncbi:MAG: hypothetical protein L0210_09460, partial [Rhodospirillales bacterium]|nr:hypothetical protein [Rhodospirillales bacterium]